MTLNEVLKNTNYDVSLFSEEARKYIEDAIILKTVRGKETPFIICLKRGKEIVLKPEEAVRQLYLYKLIHEYGYLANRIEVEFPIHFGREVKRADIAIMDKDRPMVPYIIVELKKPKLSDGKEQLKSYCNATGAPIGVWTNGEQISYYNRKDPNYFEPITNIPKASEKLSDIINEKFTYHRETGTGYCGSFCGICKERRSKFFSISPSVEPFDEAKYKALMDGLECSEIYFSQIDLGDRFDSDYYTKN